MKPSENDQSDLILIAHAAIKYDEAWHHWHDNVGKAGADEKALKGSRIAGHDAMQAAIEALRKKRGGTL